MSRSYEDAEWVAFLKEVRRLADKLAILDDPVERAVVLDAMFALVVAKKA